MFNYGKAWSKSHKSKSKSKPNYKSKSNYKTIFNIYKLRTAPNFYSLVSSICLFYNVL